MKCWTGVTAVDALFCKPAGHYVLLQTRMQAQQASGIGRKVVDDLLIE